MTLFVEQGDAFEDAKDLRHRFIEGFYDDLLGDVIVVDVRRGWSLRGYFDNALNKKSYASSRC